MIFNALETIFFYSSIIAIVVVSCCYIKGFIANKSTMHSNVSYVQIISFSALFTALNYFCTNISLKKGIWEGDRGNYLYSFGTGRSNSMGLDFLYSVAHSLSFDFITLLYLTTFLCCILFFFALKKTKYFSTYSLIFLFSTDLIFLTFAQLKQCYTVGFSCVFFAYMLKNKQERNDLICLLLAFLASCFHVTGYLLFPIYFAIRFIEVSKNKFNVVLLVMLLILGTFGYVLKFMASIFSDLLPVISAKITTYFLEEEIYSDGSWLTFIKGVPFYAVVLFAYLRRGAFSKIISDYDKYLFLSTIGALLYLMSIQSYWMFRFTALFYLPFALLFGVIMRNERDSISKWLLFLVVIGSLIVMRVRHILLVYIVHGGY